MQRLFSALLRWRFTTVILLLVLVAIASSGARHLNFKNNYEIFFDDDNPQLQALERMQQSFSKSDNLLIILAPPADRTLTPETLSNLHWLTEQAWQIPYSTRVDSITNFQHTFAEEDDLVVEDLLLDPEGLSADDVKRVTAIALDEPQLKHRLISEDGAVVAVNVTLQLPEEDPNAELQQVVSAARALSEEITSRQPELTVYLTGIVMMNNAFSESSIDDASTLIPIMLATIIVLVGLLNRSISGTFATLVVIITSITAALGLAGWLGIYLSGPSASAPTVILTLAVADCVHILATFNQKLRQGEARDAAMQHSLQINLRPVLLTSATTAIGFLSMNFSDSPPFRDLGNIVAMGVGVACLLSLTLFPALLALLPVRSPGPGSRGSSLMQQLADWVIRRQRRILATTLLLVAGALALLPLNELNDNFVEYFDRSVPFRVASDYSNDHLTGLAYMEIELDSGSAQGISDPAFMGQVEQFARWLRQQPETVHVQTLTDTLSRLNMNLHGDNRDYYRLPDDREESAQYLLLYEMSLPYGLDLNNQINVDKSALRLIVNFETLTSLQLIEMEQRIGSWLATNAPAINAAVSGPPLMFAHIGQRNIISMLTGTLLALLLISATLALALRSVRYGLLSLLPNMAPMVIGFGLWGLLVGEVGLGLSVVSGMTLGIVVDDTVHFLSKYLDARRQQGLNAEDAIRYAFNTVGRALWITTLVLGIGFMVLAQSSFRINSDMGLLTAATIVIALVMDFLMLPALLLFMDRHRTTAAARNPQPL
ncbi:efflux RND transporter permease subunit [Motiliproteus sediminis]|uniref:efflux RND transporter permease subunit n=1 Tax=Motiliproteus sediminis TaxID=1468178 RepID=UPI001AEF5DB9|nr:MMPL family transporter [Motiliproteus sediminis]